MKLEGEQVVLEKCVNPFCNRPFRRLSEGKLFVVEFPQTALDRLAHRVAGREHFWLCHECARIMTLAIRREFDNVSVRIINLPPDGTTKMKFEGVPPEKHSHTSHPEVPHQEIVFRLSFA